MFDANNVIILLLNAFLVGLTAWVYAEPLTEPEEIFNPVYRWAERVFPWYIFKPLIGCFKCVSGQWAFWFYLITLIDFSHVNINLYYKDFGFNNNYNFIEHMLFIGSTIFFALVVNKVLKKREIID